MKGDPLGFFNIHSVAKHQKIEGGKIFIFGKKSHSAEKNCKGDPLGFSNIHSDAKQQKIEGDPLGKFFFPKKVSQYRKKMKGGTLWSRPVWYVNAVKQEKPFWFSSLGQMVLFDTIIFCRTFKNYFGQFVWIEKKPL